MPLQREPREGGLRLSGQVWARGDRKSTRLNSSHSQISYAVFCLIKNRRGLLRHLRCLEAELVNPAGLRSTVRPMGDDPSVPVRLSPGSLKHTVALSLATPPEPRH